MKCKGKCKKCGQQVEHEKLWVPALSNSEIHRLVERAALVRTGYPSRDYASLSGRETHGQGSQDDYHAFYYRVPRTFLEDKDALSNLVEAAAARILDVLPTMSLNVQVTPGHAWYVAHLGPHALHIVYDDEKLRRFGRNEEYAVLRGYLRALLVVPG